MVETLQWAQPESFRTSYAQSPLGGSCQVRREYFVAFPPEPPGPLEKEPVAVKTEDSPADVISCNRSEGVLVDSSQSEDSQSEDEESRSEDSGTQVEPPPKVRRFRPRLAVSEQWYAHQKSNILHLLDLETSTMQQILPSAAADHVHVLTISSLFFRLPIQIEH